MAVVERNKFLRSINILLACAFGWYLAFTLFTSYVALARELVHAYREMF